jgi:hypothetical protein
VAIPFAPATGHVGSSHRNALVATRFRKDAADVLSRLQEPVD